MSEHDYRHDEDKSDILWGAEAIAAYLNLGVRQVFYMAARDQLPVSKVGSRLCASKRKLAALAEGGAR